MSTQGTYSSFKSELLKAIYNKSKNDGASAYSAGEIVDLAGLEFQEGWLAQVAGDWVAKGWIKGPNEIGPERDRPLFLTGHGLEAAEKSLQAEADKTFKRRFTRFFVTNWIALGALLVSIIALFRSGT